MKLLFIGMLLSILVPGQAQSKFTVYFDFNRYALTADGMRQLDSFLLAKRESGAKYIISLDGYCDPPGTDDYNRTLSLRRVSSVKQHLLNNGIQQRNIVQAKGHGEKDPLNENRTEEERQLNRRVTISLAETTKENQTLKEKIADSTTVAGTSIVLKNMNFYGGTPLLLPESFSIIEELIETMKVNYRLVIEIQGHICCVPYADDSPYGPTGTGLSEERAKTIYAELVGHGIEPNRVSYKGFGHSMPVYPYPEKTEEERIANRRVEIKIISK